MIGNDKVPGVTVAEGWGEGQDHQRGDGQAGGAVLP